MDALIDVRNCFPGTVTPHPKSACSRLNKLSRHISEVCSV
nr:MAG TPA: hypothetical protein [Caudoviricetes sp.]